MLSTKLMQYFKINPLVIYHSQINAVSCSINMIEFGITQLNSTFLFSNIDKIKNFHPSKAQDNQKFLLDLANENLIDNIKISICFENIFKAILLSELYIIHKIDKNIHSNLATKQNNTPIELNEIINANDGWSINHNIDETDGINRVILGLNKQTINYSVLLEKENYWSRFKLEEKLRLDLINMNNERNNLHLHNSVSCKLSSESYNSLMRIRLYIDEFISPLQKEYCNFLGIKTKLFGVIIENS